ncbi:hypothetical protein [Microbacterium sp. SSM24]|uniref:hypothetical protein n=1 Tax=Microbacterium sp. SSM24 TaxID=2991714 RepID=UPI002226F7C7|nr:hypothetical protein [Microbacterium sp. SSM24]MCW3494484.1 hypothetical protein [Microbacterium sp. SSM24]
MNTPAPALGAQRRFLVRLSGIEKSQRRRDIICTAIEFSGEEVVLFGGASGARRTLALGSSDALMQEALQTMWNMPLDPPDGLADRYPSQLDLAGCWAELHYDLGRTNYLDEIDSSIRYDEIRLVDGSGVVSASSVARKKSGVVRVVLDRGEAPIHVADELSAMLDRAPAQT